MKHLSILLCMVVSISLNAQYTYITNFENHYDFNLTIDSLSLDKWHVGEPNKEYFLSAYSQPNAILTDSSSTYAINQSSSFVIKLPEEALDKFPYTQLEWFQKVDAEENVDGGIIEISYDLGQTWSNVIDDPIYRPAVVGNYTTGLLANGQMGFTGQLDWSYVAICWGTFYGYPPPIIPEIWIKFTFFSDSNDTQQDGWMLDDFKYVLGIIGATTDQEISASELKIFPNPMFNELNIDLDGMDRSNASLKILNTSGQIVFSQKINTTMDSQYSLSTKNLPDGMYQIYVQTENTIYQNRFVKQEGN